MSTVSETDFRYIRDWLAAETAIVLDESKRYLVESRVDPVLRVLGLADASALVAKMRAGDRRSRDAVVDAMTTNETSWYRDNAPFDALRDTLLPAVIKANAATRRLAVWSAACSSGQEIYSVAMLLDSSFPELATWDVDLLATDISPAIVEKARKAQFSPLEVNRGLPAPMLVKYFTREGVNFALDEKLRKKVRFQLLNLAEPFAAMRPQDIVLLRNVLIYFDEATKRQILERVARVLRPGGYLLLGAAESTRGLSNAFDIQQVGRCTVHRLKEA